MILTLGLTSCFETKKVVSSNDLLLFCQRLIPHVERLSQEDQLVFRGLSEKAREEIKLATKDLSEKTQQEIQIVAKGLSEKAHKNIKLLNIEVLDTCIFQ